MECYRVLCLHSIKCFQCRPSLVRPLTLRLCQQQIQSAVPNVAPIFVRRLFYEPDRKGLNFEYKHKHKLKDFLSKEYYVSGLQELKKEIKLWTEEVKEQFRNDPVFEYRHGEVDVWWKFRSEEDLAKWKVTTDKDLNVGRSTATLTLSRQGYGLLSGNISTDVPQDGKIKRTGFVNISGHRARKSFKRETSYDWSFYTHLVLRCRGDGRSYLLNIHIQTDIDILWFDIFHFVLFTRGGPYWQTAKIPLSKFFLGSKGRIQDSQFPPPLCKVANFSITLGEGTMAGPFNLEIDYIGLVNDYTHNEETAYELYKVPLGIAKM